MRKLLAYDTRFCRLTTNTENAAAANNFFAFFIDDPLLSVGCSCCENKKFRVSGRVEALNKAESSIRCFYLRLYNGGCQSF